MCISVYMLSAQGDDTVIETAGKLRGALGGEPVVCAGYQPLFTKYTENDGCFGINA